MKLMKVTLETCSRASAGGEPGRVTAVTAEEEKTDRAPGTMGTSREWCEHQRIENGPWGKRGSLEHVRDSALKVKGEAEGAASCCPVIFSEKTTPLKSQQLDGPRDCHTERSKSDREIQISYDISYMWNLKKGTSELIYKTEIELRM